MQRPTGKNPNSMGTEPKAPVGSSSLNQAKLIRKAGMNKTANVFPNEEGERKATLARLAGKTTPKQIVEMQGGYNKSSMSAAQAKTAGRDRRKGGVSFGNADPNAKKPVQMKEVKMEGRDVKTMQRAVASSSSGTSNLRKPAVKSAVSKDVVQKSGRIQNQPKNAMSLDGGAKTDVSLRKMSGRKMDYYTTSSSDEECTKPPKGPNAPLSPASKAKMWNDINKSPGPTYPGWKFRSSPEGRHLSQMGAEELTATLKNMKMEAKSKAVNTTPKGPSKFSDYMKKMKASARVGEDLSESSLQQSIELKHVYAEQLDAMHKRAWDSLQALDANLKKTSDSGLRTSFDKFMEGASRTSGRVTVSDLARSGFKGKGASKSLEKKFAQGDVVQADDFSSDDSDMMSPPFRAGTLSPGGSKPAKPMADMEDMLADIRSTRKNLAKGDGLQDSDTASTPDSDKMSKLRPRPSGRGDSSRSGTVRPTQDSSYSRVSSDQFKSLTDEDPLKKLKMISKQLKMDNAQMLSRKVPQAQAIKFSSSDDDSNDFDAPCTYKY